jgi:ADP-ribose pyrophosphatase YjhB (NUDIX family)
METRGCQVHKLVADVCLVADQKILLARYKDTSGYDGEQGWFLPDDYLHHSEHPQEAAHRILKEQAGIEVPALDIGSIESFEGHGYWHLIFHYYAHLSRLPAASPGRNVLAAEWFPADGLPSPEEVAHGGWALETIQTVLSRN